MAKRQQRTQKTKNSEVAKDLNARQFQFCLEMIRCRKNATLAYQKAYNVKASTARANGSRLKQDPRIQAEIRILENEIEETSQMEVKEIIRRLEWIACSDITNVIDVNSTDTDEVISLRDMSDLPPDVTYAIEEVTATQSKNAGQKTTVKLANKLKAIELILRIRGYLSDFNGAITTLAKHGLYLYQDKGDWKIEQDPRLKAVMSQSESVNISVETETDID